MSRRKTMTWSRSIDQFESHLRAKRSARLTLLNYLGSLEQLKVYLEEERGVTSPSDVSLEDLRAYQCDLFTGEASSSGKPLSAKTVQTKNAAWTGFFGFLHAEGLLKTNPAANLEKPKVPRKAPGHTLTVREVKRLFRTAAQEPMTANRLRDKAMLEVLYATGVRRAELLALNLEDLDSAERRITIRCGKGGKGRHVPVIRSAWSSLQTYVELGRPQLQNGHSESFRALFLSKKTGGRFSAEGLKYVLDRIRTEAGLKKKLSPHVFRRTCATHLMKNGVSLRHIQLLLGHVDLNTTAQYLRLDTRELRKTVLLRHPRERISV